MLWMDGQASTPNILALFVKQGVLIGLTGFRTITAGYPVPVPGITLIAVRRVADA